MAGFNLSQMAINHPVDFRIMGRIKRIRCRNKVVHREQCIL
jgi:hypothetical protein